MSKNQGQDPGGVPAHSNQAGTPFVSIANQALAHLLAVESEFNNRPRMGFRDHFLAERFADLTGHVRCSGADG